MFLIVALVLLSVGVGFFLSIYSSFFPFMQNFSSITQYNSAYYSAIGSVERASLVLKYRDSGFEGSGGFLGSTGWGPLSDQALPFFTGDDQGMWRSITSRTMSIPASGDGNTDIMLRAPDSAMYNKIDASTLEIFPLSMDVITSEELYYSGANHSLVYFSGDSISGVFRLPPVVKEKFGSGLGPNAALLCAANSFSCTPDESRVYDKEVVNWQLSGMNANPEGYLPFKIIPTSNIFQDGEVMRVNTPYDNLLRASVINDSLPLLFTNSFSPMADRGNGLSGHSTIPANASGIKNTSFQDIFRSNSQFQNLQLSFGLTSLLRSNQGSLYPYLEYRFTFPQLVSDRFFTIEAHGHSQGYDIQLIFKKPVMQGIVQGISSGVITPSFVAVCKDITVSLDPEGNAVIQAADVDGGSGVVSRMIDKSSFSCSDIGANTVTLTVTDSVGTRLTCTSVVTIVDTLPPTISCPREQGRNTNPKIQGYATIASEFNPTATNDNCPNTTISYGLLGATVGIGTNTLAGIIFNNGITNVTWTVSDSSNNITPCTFTVTVNAPVP